jgi:hypothetical protein
LKVKNIQNIVFLSYKVITKINGMFDKSAKINIKYGYNIIYVTNVWEYVSMIAVKYAIFSRV